MADKKTTAKKTTIKKPAPKKAVSKATPKPVTKSSPAVKSKPTKDFKYSKLPVLVVRDTIVFPGFTQKILIGRKESKAAVEISKSKFDSNIIVVMQKNLIEQELNIANISSVGVVCKLQDITNNTTLAGSINVNLIGLDKVYLSELNLKEYMEANPIQFKDKIEDSKKLALLHTELIEQFKQTINKLQIDVNKEQINPFLSSPTTELVDAFAYYIPAPIALKNKILNEVIVEKRISYILEFFKEYKTGNGEDQQKQLAKEINEKVKGKFSDQQREFFLREQMKAIKEELEEISGSENEIEGYKKRLDSNPYPEYIKTKLKTEIRRMEQTPSSSQETNVIRTYIETILDLPFWQKTEDKVDIKKAAALLDKEHYGLTKVKERIIEFLALKEKNPEAKGTILCLVGAPGTGKTSLAKSIADSLNKKMVKISLGGVRDEAEIRGHRRTYIASMPGKIISAMKKAGVINPVILLDEIDKMSSDYKGDPASAMLEVLDYEQNVHFQDHFIEEEYDLSKVMFICTANYIDNIPRALHDRLEIIDVSSYTELEKVEIAKLHLIPKVLKDTKLEKGLLKLPDDLIKWLVRHYTMEAGVRNLQRVFESISRKLLVKELKGKPIKKLDKEVLIELLGREKFNFTKKEIEPQVGSVMGLAWTSYGGDILPIEVTLYPGKGNVILTGSLKDVMKESATIALSYVKSNYQKFGINIEVEDKEKTIFNSNDFHIHVPEGATPKDGPSAGVTFTSAIISALSKKPVSQYIAMTGEITLRGKVLPIGGLKEKSISAYRSGLKEIFIPKENEKDLIDIPKEVIKNLKINSVEYYPEIYKRIFPK